MAYGRLDVFWPDGQFKTFALVENNVSVGRSSGNAIMLDTTTISRYHFSLTHDGQQVHITDLDSVNGTFVDGVKLTSNEPRMVFGGEEIQAGHLRMVYHRIDEMPTQPMSPVEEVTQRIELALTTFRLDVQGPDQAFSPGAHMSAELAVTNLMADAQRFLVQVEGVPKEWVRIDRPEPEIKPEDTATILINFKPLRRSDSKPGLYTVTVRVFPKNNPETKLEAQFPVRILAYSGFGVALDPQVINSGERLRLYIHNQGSAALPLTISGRDMEGRKLDFAIPTAQTALAPGQRMTIQGEVKPVRPKLFGSPQKHPFDLLVRSSDASGFLAAVRGYFVEKPMLPAWTPYAIAVSAVAAGILGLLLLVLLLGPRPQPNIATVAVNSTQIARGNPLEISWAATDVSRMSVAVNGTPVVSDLLPETTGLSINTETLDGAVIVSLTGANGNRQIVATQEVYIYQPLGTPTVNVNPPQLVRYVVQNLSVNWDVPGATVTRLTGLEAFNAGYTAQDYGSEAAVAEAGVPVDSFSLTLYAQDEVGNFIQQVIDVQVINPECVPAEGGITLYAGPDVRHQVVGTVPQGAFVVVNAQNENGQWLRVPLTGGLSGWGQVEKFTCGNFAVSDLLKEINLPTVPPPTPTPTPSATPTPTATASPTRTLTPTQAAG